MTAAPHADTLRRMVDACASITPGYEGYDERGARRRTEEAVRRAAAASVRNAGGWLADWQRDLTSPGDLVRAAQVERLITRVRNTIQRLEAAPRRFGGWFGDKELPVDVRLALAVADRHLLEAARELADTARAGLEGGRSGPDGRADPAAYRPDPGRMTVLREALEAVRRQASDRSLLLADEHSPAAPPGTGGADAYPGESLLLEGVPHDVVKRSRWPAGDIALELTSDSGGLVLWVRQAGEVIAFEAQHLKLSDGPTDRIAAADQEFVVARHDRGLLHERDALGRHRREAERWLYQGPGGVWLWVESDGGKWLTMRGVPVDPEELATG